MDDDVLFPTLIDIVTVLPALALLGIDENTTVVFVPIALDGGRIFDCVVIFAPITN
jgi:hypothetical protein